MPVGVYPRRFTPLAVRFWAKVDKNGPIPTHCPEIGPCWLWTRYRDPNGYGRIAVAKGQKPERTHRVSWLLNFGSIPDGKSVLHKCDNRACVRPEHFFLGDHTANALDMVEKGRHYSVTSPDMVLRGERSGRAKLNESAVRAIRESFAAGAGNQYQLADRYGVSQSVIWRVVHRKSWKHVA